MFENFDLTTIQDENARELIQRLLNLIETLTAGLREAQAENQRLRDENNRLKGEQGKPKIKANTPKAKAADHSSEKERRKTRERHKSGKKVNIQIDREQVVEIDQSKLPEDAEFKGYEETVVQDITLRTDNVRFWKKKYHSATTGKSYEAEQPKGYEGQFGPGVKTLTLAMYFGMGISEPKIVEFFKNIGIQISKGGVSNLLIKKQGNFHAEKDAVYEAGLRSSPWQQTDDTQTRVNGQNEHCHVVCNPVYTTYHTMPKKDRLTILDVLRNRRDRVYRLNGEAFAYLEYVHLAQTVHSTLQGHRSEKDLYEAAFEKLLKSLSPALSEKQYKQVYEAAAIAAYHAETGFPVLWVLVCDDAPQFRWLTKAIMLCWIHAGRHYKKLAPVIAYHRELLAGFLKRFWEYYDQLLAYRQSPTPAECTRLEIEFDQLFATRTGYAELDERIIKTQANKASLLLVLEYPELPLHNNAAELAVRQRVRKRDVSFGPRTPDGTRAWDTFMSLSETTKKLGVSFYQYIHDRICQTNQIPPLADLVTQAAKDINLGRSWSAA